MQGFACTIPYDWQENQWYSVRLDAMTDKRWQASVQPVLSNAANIIGTIETAAAATWARPQMAVAYPLPIDADSCLAGLPPVSMRFTFGVANDTQILLPNKLVKCDCVKATEGSGEGLRTIDGERVYERKLGG